MSGVGSQTAEAKLMQVMMVLKGWSVTDLARRAGLTRNYTSLTVHGHRGSEVARRRIARALGMDVERAFPKVEGVKRSKVEKGEE
jgi:transcriptional regulator with XRE-family HTH domain